MLDFNCMPEYLEDISLAQNPKMWAPESLDLRDWIQTLSDRKSTFVVRRLDDASVGLIQINELRELKADWNDDGALCVSEYAIKAAIKTLTLLNQKTEALGYDFINPTIAACADGSVDFYWDNRAAKLLVNFPPSGTAEFAGKALDFEISGKDAYLHTDILVKFIRDYVN